MSAELIIAKRRERLLVTKTPQAMPEIMTVAAFTELIKDENTKPLLTKSSPYNDIFSMTNCFIRDRKDVDAKMHSMVKGGHEKLMVISDFDFTMTKFDDPDGKRFSSSPGIMTALADELLPEIGEKFRALCKHYIPIEFDPMLTMEEKIPHMEDFWRKSHELTIEAGFDKTTIEDFVRRCNIQLRDGCVEWMNSLKHFTIPLVIFSAGIGDVIDIFLQEKMSLTQLPETLHIISNMIEYDEEEKVKSFSEPLIHTFCKNSSVIKKEKPFFHHINQRTNILLLGDSLGDIHMDVGVEKEEATLKIGFLNYKVEELLPHFMEIYDIVLVQERSFNLPTKILNAIVSDIIL